MMRPNLKKGILKPTMKKLEKSSTLPSKPTESVNRDIDEILD